MPPQPSSSPSDPRWSDLERPALDGTALTAALVRDSRLWRSVEVVASIGSTNAELVRRAGEEAPGGAAPEGTVLVAEHQVAGRGRLDRVWTSPPRAGLTVSVLLRPDVPAARRGWLPLLTGVALAEAVGAVPGVRAAVKWPNDLLAADGSKLAGILAESVPAADPPAVVVGVGLNVSTRPDELPEGASSLAMEVGRTVDRAPVLLQFLRALERRYRAWTAVLGDPVQSGLAHDYLAWSATVGTDVRVTLPDGSTLEGTAEAVDWDGRLVVRTAGGTVDLASGDVRHVRPRRAPGG
ncbi:biotin--[acetyl-CoA-carboxylase] ligase [Blastococcus sp. SYSU D00695]